jgi:hypothetical protein
MTRGTTYQYAVDVTLVVETCCSCGVAFGLETRYREERLRKHSLEFHCPNGHPQHYIGETEEQKLRRQLRDQREYAAALAAERDQVEMQRRAYKGQVTKLRKRTLDGECSICGKRLAHLDRHVRRMHAGEQADVE